MLRSQNISFRYSGGVELLFPDIDCSRGEHSLLLGQSGSGKTTLLHILGGMRSPTSGNVFINEASLNSLSQSALDKFRGRNIGIVFQTSHFVKALTVKENLVIAQKFAGLPQDLDRIKELLDHLNILHKIDARTNRLSQGEQQRVAIARALVNKPAIILADEPTSSLDDTNTDEVINLLIREVNEVNATLLVVTHDYRLKDRFTKRFEL